MGPLLFPLEVCLTLVTICYIVQCSFTPWGTCRRCHGNRPACRWCRGTGKRPRILWQLAAYVLRTWKDNRR
jgi:hypothetical protein